MVYTAIAPVTTTSFVTGDKFAAPIKLVQRHSYNSQNLYRDGKKCAIPSLHRDSLPAKVPGPCPVLSSGNTTSLYCRAVSCKAFQHYCTLITNTQVRVLQPVPATIPSQQNTCFFASANLVK
jgi:hypothetical protein